MNFLTHMGERWNISLFHYRNHGSAYGRVLCGVQVPEADEGVPIISGHTRISEFCGNQQPCLPDVLELNAFRQTYVELRAPVAMATM